MDFGSKIPSWTPQEWIKGGVTCCPNTTAPPIFLWGDEREVITIQGRVSRNPMGFHYNPPFTCLSWKKTISTLMDLQSNGMRVFMELPANWTGSLQQHFLLSFSTFSWGFQHSSLLQQDMVLKSCPGSNGMLVPLGLANTEIGRAKAAEMAGEP